MKNKHLTDEQLASFRDSLNISLTGKAKDGTSYNDIGRLNQAAWLGERAGLLLDEVERLREQRDRWMKKCFAAELRREELLAACKAMLVYIDKNWPGKRAERLPVQEMRAAIAKAEGS